MIRRPGSWWPGNVEVGGTHIHHLVWGIVTDDDHRLRRGDDRAALALARDHRRSCSGSGLGLALDEFALWLDLKDVYWCEQGRKSIDAVIIAGDDHRDGAGRVHRLGGRRRPRSRTSVFALVGAFGRARDRGRASSTWRRRSSGWPSSACSVPPVGLVAPFRLGKPHSLWARIFYRERRRRRAPTRGSASRSRAPEPAQPEPATVSRPPARAEGRAGAARRRLGRRRTSRGATAAPRRSARRSWRRWGSPAAPRGCRRARAPDQDRDDRDRRVDPDGVLVEERLDHPVLDLLVDDEQHQPDDQRLGEVVEGGDDRDEERRRP